MRVLCCLDGTNIELISSAISTLVAADQRIIGLLYVTDLGPHHEIERKREGWPEREIIQCAFEWNADLIIICSRSAAFGGPALGPKSVGHVARFVLDHAPCPVLLVRLPGMQFSVVRGFFIPCSSC
jgi:nucleotide-binding universal stress UspA family protein